MNNSYGSDTTAPCGTACGGDILACLPIPASCAQALRRLRAPALRVQYSMEKQFVPDLDTARGAASGSTGTGSCAGQSSPQESGQDSEFGSGWSGQPQSTAGNKQSGGQSNTPGTMREQGSFTVRLFDLAVGSVLVLTAVCMVKCCCGMKRVCRRWF